MIRRRAQQDLFRGRLYGPEGAGQRFRGELVLEQDCGKEGRSPRGSRLP
jgi:hypothetical protein